MKSRLWKSKHKEAQEQKAANRTGDSRHLTPWGPQSPSLLRSVNTLGELWVTEQKQLKQHHETNHQTDSSSHVWGRSFRSTHPTHLRASNWLPHVSIEDEHTQVTKTFEEKLLTWHVDTKQTKSQKEKKGTQRKEIHHREQKKKYIMNVFRETIMRPWNTQRSYKRNTEQKRALTNKKIWDLKQKFQLNGWNLKIEKITQKAKKTIKWEIGEKM